MKYAVIADIHANLEALRVVLEDAKKQNCTHYVCLGDVVGYNANPKECLDIIRDTGMPSVKGNHDDYCSSETNRAENISSTSAVSASRATAIRRRRTRFTTWMKARSNCAVWTTTFRPRRPKLWRLVCRRDWRNGWPWANELFCRRRRQAA